MDLFETRPVWAPPGVRGLCRRSRSKYDGGRWIYDLSRAAICGMRQRRVLSDPFLCSSCVHFQAVVNRRVRGRF